MKEFLQITRIALILAAIALFCVGAQFLEWSHHVDMRDGIYEIYPPNAERDLALHLFKLMMITAVFAYIFQLIRKHIL